MERFFHEKQGCSVLDGHNSQPADYTDLRFLSAALWHEDIEKLRNIIMWYLYTEKERF
jgi:hypothetical protein